MSKGKRSLGVAKILFAFAVALSLFALVLIFQYLSTAEDRALKSFDTVKVLVATEPISRGTSLYDAEQQKLIEIRTYPAEALPLSSLEKISTANGNLVALMDVVPGQILVNEIFGDRIKPAIDFNLPAGKVAITLNLTYAARVAAFLKPGVNVALFSTSNEQNNRPSSTTTLFRSIQVLAIGQQIDPDKSMDVGEIADFVTVAVNYDQASQLIQAIQNSRIYLALLTDSSLVGAQVETGKKR
jgi:pilus assembly protein CpaB